MKRPDRRVSLAIAGVCALAMVFFEYYPIDYSTDEVLSSIIKMVITRGLGSVMFTVILFYLGYRVHNFSRIWRSLAYCLPCV